MYGDTRVWLLGLLALSLAGGADPAAAEGGPGGIAGAGPAVGSNSAAATLPRHPPPPETAGMPSPWAEPIGAPDAAPLPGVLRQIGERQTELAILELDIKRAELRKKLRELNGESALQPAVGLAVVNGGAPTREIPEAKGVVGDPLVRRIHKVGHDLVASLAFSDGETKEVRAGTILPNDLKVIVILPDAVRVRRGAQSPYELGILPISPGGNHETSSR